LERRNTLINKVRDRLSLQDGEPPSYRELAVAAGVSVPTLRHYFGSREQVIKAVFAQALIAGASHLSRARLPEAEDLEASLQSFLQRVVLGWTQGNVGALHRIGLAEGLRNPGTGLDYLTDVLEPTLQALETRLAHYRQRGLIVECNTRHAALMLLSPVVLALLHQHDLGGTRCRPLAIPELITEHVKVFARAYRAS
jgi:AcrR family transcriptional regulator